MDRERDSEPTRDDVDPADALGGAAALPLPEGQPRGVVPTEREPGRGVAPEAVPEDERDDA